MQERNEEADGGGLDDICIYIPHGKNSIDPKLFDWCLWLERQRTGIGIERYECTAGPAEARNRIVSEFLAKDSRRWIWFIDSDTIPPRNLSLLDHREESLIVCGWYNTYRPDLSIRPIPCVYLTHPNIPGATVGYKQKNWPEEEAFEADAAGTGCMLIDRKLFDDPEFERLEPFVYGRYNGRFLGEDITFCLRAVDAGLGRVRIVRDYKCDHMNVVSLNTVEIGVALAEYKG